MYIPIQRKHELVIQEPGKRNIYLVALTSYIKYVSAFFNVINNGFD